MKELAIKFGKSVFEYFRSRCKTKDFLLNQDCRSSRDSRLLELDETPTQDVVISILNSGLSRSGYHMP